MTECFKLYMAHGVVKNGILVDVIDSDIPINSTTLKNVEKEVEEYGYTDCGIISL